jgi:hypothetical protein
VALLLLAASLLLPRTTVSARSTSGATGGTVPPPPTEAPWVTWAPPDDSFHIDFPKQPQLLDQDQGWVGEKLAQDDYGSLVYAIGWIDVPTSAGSLSDPAVLDSVVSRVVQHTFPGAAVRASTFQGRPSYEFFGTGHLDNGHPLAGKGAAFVVGQRIYLLLAFAAPEEPAVGWDRFESSFRLG